MSKLLIGEMVKNHVSITVKPAFEKLTKVIVRFNDKIFVIKMGSGTPTLCGVLLHIYNHDRTLFNRMFGGEFNGHHMLVRDIKHGLEMGW